MPSGKLRLYIALYPSGVVNNEERKTHPRKDGSTKKSSWTTYLSTTNLLARILIAKVEDHNRVVAILRSLPVVQDDPAWRCRAWIATALAELARDGKAVGTSQLDWAIVEATARQYVARKAAAGRYERVEDVLKPKPTWDMLEGQETVA
ncbi:hypothetical protein LTR91_018412 [Friedmanniomyces endolithicus]|uniref:Uncharacterized protein n=1 Tax=Friedmanniomyces endolithicus TaxID=329885 RepID=A0AAN6K4N8_9PEZI|nr:hypothetical protein LTR35_003301 [Friedmanniomyces endolithicus]KAK0293157.1 hypothetical protein LTS00_007759 [Friedmanniomyces endolithicus]KAK0319492.1 hypothetical protein LTR82_009558 [Friedmanniomyces endolithicus]KAK0930231.1 hypothetical protein LTR57_001400 [Friedmanniomyces endolithicus]KAK0964549.1 hypothetical protein LTR91_018412 [Friedmanniomyces endolithicus]